MASIILCICAFVFGAIIGSFINVCVYRIPRGISVVKPRSFCPACGASLIFIDMIPLASYIIKLGKCSSCGTRISVRYLMIEFLCGALWAAHFWVFGFSFQFVCYAALCSILLAIFFIDIEWMRIPNILVICAMLPALAALARYSLFLSPPERFRSIYGSIGGADPLLGLLPCAAFIIIYIVTALLRGGQGGVGIGDIKLLAPIGLALGLRQSLLAAFISVMLGGLTGLVLIASGIKTRKDPIPFGPFIVVGAVVAVFIPVSNIF